MAKWLRAHIFSAHRHFNAVGPSPARYTCETSQVLLVGGQRGVLWNLPFSLHLTIDSAQNE